MHGDELPFLFPLYFVALWLAISTGLGAAAGWFRLQGRYPAGDEQPLLTLRGRSGSMGLSSSGVS